jgi:ubiquinol-cytochrome c reductase cytochrome c subunit
METIMVRPAGMLFGAMLLANLASAADPVGDPKAGEARFMRVGCYECHGTVGQGGIAGMRIVPMPLPWLGFQVYLRRPGGQMPAFSDKVLTDGELADIYAFLTGLPAGRGAAEISLLHDPASN